MLVPGWWLAVTVICFILSTVCIVGLLVALAATTAKVQQMVVQASNTGLPKLMALTDQVNAIGVKVDGLMARIDQESHVALPKVEHMLDRVDHTMELVEANSERVNSVIEGTTEGINKVRHNPMTKTVLISAGSLAAARFLKNTIGYYSGRGGNGHANGNGHSNGNGHRTADAKMTPGTTVLELPQDE